MLDFVLWALPAYLSLSQKNPPHHQKLVEEIQTSSRGWFSFSTMLASKSDLHVLGLVILPVWSWAFKMFFFFFVVIFKICIYLLCRCVCPCECSASKRMGQKRGLDRLELDLEAPWAGMGLRTETGSSARVGSVLTSETLLQPTLPFGGIFDITAYDFPSPRS